MATFPYSNSHISAFIWIRVLDVETKEQMKRMETAEMRFSRAVAAHRMTYRNVMNILENNQE